MCNPSLKEFGIIYSEIKIPIIQKNKAILLRIYFMYLFLFNIIAPIAPIIIFSNFNIAKFFLTTSNQFESIWSEKSKTTNFINTNKNKSLINKIKLKSVQNKWKSIEIDRNQKKSNEIYEKNKNQ